jgi:hypothetical protein
MEVNSGGVKFGTSDGFLEFCHDHDVVRDKQCEDRYHGCGEPSLEKCRQDPGDDEGGGY